MLKKLYEIWMMGLLSLKNWKLPLFITKFINYLYLNINEYQQFWFFILDGKMLTLESFHLKNEIMKSDNYGHIQKNKIYIIILN